MHDEIDLREFPNITCLFPLPGVVLFPHVVLPLHIFEPRYRQMTEHALAADRLITMVQLAGDPSEAPTDAPAIESVGCLGRIIRHERLDDGRFNILLLGLKRVRLLDEIPRDCLYRKALVEILDEINEPGEAADIGDRLVSLFRSASGLDYEMSRMLDTGLPLGVLTDLLAHALPIAPGLKQALLAEPRASLRARALTRLLERAIRGRDAGSRPHRSSTPFSLN
jgi:Lon protease-like protein